MLVGAVLGLGCGAVRAVTQPPPRSVRRVVAPQSDDLRALLSKQDREDLRRILSENLAVLRRRARVLQVKAPAPAAEPDLQPPGYREEPPPKLAAASDDEADALPPSLILGAVPVQRPSSVERVSVPRVELPAYPAPAAVGAQPLSSALRPTAKRVRGRLLRRDVRTRLRG